MQERRGGRGPGVGLRALPQSCVKGGHIKFAKIDGAATTLLHKRRLAFRYLLTLAHADLQIGLPQLRARLDPARRLFIYGEHACRMAADGGGFVPAGRLTLERLVFASLIRQ